MKPDDLASKVVAGAVFLTARQVAAMVVGLGSLVLITRLIGPAAYGVFAGAYGVILFTNRVGQLGIGVYLIRKRTLTAGDVDSGFALLTALGCLCAILIAVFAGLIRGLTRVDGLEGVLVALALTLPFQMAGLVPLALLERNLDYRHVTIAEIAGVCAFAVVGIVGAMLGYGSWAPTAAWMTQVLVTAGLNTLFSGYVPGFSGSVAETRTALRYGASYSASLSIWQLKDIANVLIVGRYGGASGVGFVALTIRIVEALSFARSAAWRIAMAAMARIQDEPRRLAEAIADGMRLQVLGVGVVMVLGGVVLPIAVRLVLGSTWDPVVVLFPFIGLSYLVNSAFSMHSSALYVLERNWDVGWFHLLHVTIFFGGAVAFVNAFGWIGYGLAEGLALTSYASIHMFAVRAVGPVRYGPGLWWLVAFGLALFYPLFGPATLLGLLMVLVMPQTHGTLGGYLGLLQRYFRSAFSRGVKL